MWPSGGRKAACASFPATRRAARVSRLLPPEFPLPDRRLSLRGVGGALRLPGRDAVPRRGGRHAPRVPAAARARASGPRPAHAHPRRSRLRHGALSLLRQGQLSALALCALDLSPYYLGEAQKALASWPEVEFIQGKSEAMPLASGAADIVTALYLFHELPPKIRAQTAREIARLLKPKGTFILLELVADGRPHGFRRASRGFSGKLPRALLRLLRAPGSRRAVWCRGALLARGKPGVPVEGRGVRESVIVTHSLVALDARNKSEHDTGWCMVR